MTITKIIAADGLTYEYDSLTYKLHISGEGPITAMSYGKIGTELDASSVFYLYIGYGITEIPENCFRNCYNLTTAEMPESLTRIYGYAFCNCTNIHDIYFPASLDRIDGSAFFVNALQNLIFLGNRPTTLGGGIFQYPGDPVRSMTVHSNGWADLSTLPQAQFGNNTSVTYVTDNPAVYQYFKADNSKVQVESAIRDEDGVRIKTNYLKKGEGVSLSMNDIIVAVASRCNSTGIASGTAGAVVEDITAGAALGGTLTIMGNSVTVSQGTTTLTRISATYAGSFDYTLYYATTPISITYNGQTSTYTHKWTFVLEKD